jgi:hypothetical protein
MVCRMTAVTCTCDMIDAAEGLPSMTSDENAFGKAVCLYCVTTRCHWKPTQLGWHVLVKYQGRPLVTPDHLHSGHGCCGIERPLTRYSAQLEKIIQPLRILCITEAPNACLGGRAVGR